MSFRFPKVSSSDTNRGVQGGMNSSNNDTPGNEHFFQNNSAVIVAPARYSNVRKVIFALNTGKLGNGTTSTARLKVAIASSTSPVISPELFNLPFSTVVNGATDFGFTPTLRPRFSKSGPTRTVVQKAYTALELDHAQIIQIEFDRFSPDSADFFAAWDSVTDDDDYLAFQPVVESLTADTAATIAYAFKNFECIVVQAPGNPNNSNTDWHVGLGCRDLLETTVAFQGSTNGPRHAFHFDADDWDGIESASIVFYGSHASATTLTVRLFDLTDSVVVFDENFTVTNGGPGGVGNFHVVRSQDFAASLEDGHIYYVDYLLNAAPGTIDPMGTGFISIVQKSFTRTVCVHQLTEHSFTPNPTSTTGGGAILFDPSWYEDVTDEFLLKRKMFSAFIHNAGSNNPRKVVRIDSDLLADDSARGSGTAADMGPEHTHTGTPLEPRFLFQNITANDPIDLAGQRRLQKSYLGSSTWIAGTPDFEGDMGLYYALLVPEEEVLELGPLFELGQFDPEGCASTSAGLGDNPGVLVITNGSTIPKKFNPEALRITNAGIQPPFRDQVPSFVTADAAATPAPGALAPGTYVYRYTLRNSCTGKESNPNPNDITVVVTNTPAGSVTFSFDSVFIPDDDQIDEICLYRTVAGGAFPIMAKVGCLRIDGGPPFTFADFLNDSELDFINEGLSLLNGPMPCVPVVAEFRNRLFGMGDIPELSPPGTVTVVNGSMIVVGSTETLFNRCHLGKRIKIGSDCRFYDIAELVVIENASVGGAAIGLMLSEPYEGTTDIGLNYVICGRPNRLYISEPLEPECWPEANFIDVEPGDGDRLMGAKSNFNTLLICKRRKSYVLNFSVQPATEVTVPARISSDIGCIGPRTFDQIANGTPFLSDRGIALFDGRGVRHVMESTAMNDLFTNPENPRYVRRDRNGRVIGAVGRFYPKREQYLLLLPTIQTTRGANLMVVWDVDLKNITLFEFCQEFLSMEVAKDADGNERIYLGDTNGFVWIFDIGDNDGVGFPGSTGTVKGLITSAGIDPSTGASFLEDSNATFLIGGVPELGGLSGLVGLSGLTGTTNMGLAGACVFYRPAGSGPDVPWRHKVIYASTDKKLFVTPNWGQETPEGDSQTEYMIGPIDFLADFKPANRGTDDYPKRNWRQVITHVPETVASKLRVEVLEDFDEVDPVSGQKSPDGTRTFREFSMDYRKGRQVEPIEREIHNYLRIKLSNFAPDEPIQILNHAIMVTPKTSR